MTETRFRDRARVPLRHHHGFRLAALPLDRELVEGAEIGVGGCHERIRIGPLRGHGLSTLRQPEWHANAAGVVSLSLIAAVPCGRRWRRSWATTDLRNGVRGRETVPRRFNVFIVPRENAPRSRLVPTDFHGRPCVASGVCFEAARWRLTPMR